MYGEESMKKHRWMLFGGIVTMLVAQTVFAKDIDVRIGESIWFGGIEAKMVRFGGYGSPECKLAISKDGRYFYLKKVHSTCVKMTNSRGIKIICNSDKSVCKTRGELIDLVTAVPVVKNVSTPAWCRASRLNRTEHAICADDTLSALDMKLAKVYGASKANSKDVVQRAWLRERNACGNHTGCIKQHYLSRIKELEESTSSKEDDTVEGDYQAYLAGYNGFSKYGGETLWKVCRKYKAVRNHLCVEAYFDRLSPDRDKKLRTDMPKERKKALKIRNSQEFKESVREIEKNLRSEMR